MMNCVNWTCWLFVNIFPVRLMVPIISVSGSSYCSVPNFVISSKVKIMYVVHLA